VNDFKRKGLIYFGSNLFFIYIKDQWFNSKEAMGVQPPRSTGDFFVTLGSLFLTLGTPWAQIRPFYSSDDEIMQVWLNRATQSNPKVWCERVINHSHQLDHPTVAGLMHLSYPPLPSTFKQWCWELSA
jgi:hypothetical protein